MADRGDQGDRRAGSAPDAKAHAADDARLLRRLARDFAHRPLALIGVVIVVLAALDTLLAPLA